MGQLTWWSSRWKGPRNLTSCQLLHHQPPLGTTEMLLSSSVASEWTNAPHYRGDLFRKLPLCWKLPSVTVAKIKYAAHSLAGKHTALMLLLAGQAHWGGGWWRCGHWREWSHDGYSSRFWTNTTAACPRERGKLMPSLAPGWIALTHLESTSVLQHTFQTASKQSVFHRKCSDMDTSHPDL